MKILTLTTYNVYNYGAALQAYALQKCLQCMGHDTALINYQPEYLTRKYDYRWVNPESKLSRYAVTRAAYRVMKFLQRQTTMGRKRQFDHFIASYLKQTKEYRTLEELRQDAPEADLYIVGSDQIWNVFYETGRDPAFYLDFVKQGRKASYAASFSYVDIPQSEKKRIAGYLQTFDAVSVRESHGLQLLQDMHIHGEWVLDPVFLLPVEEWKSLMTDFVKKEPYLLIYDFEGNDSLKYFAKQYARKRGLKIYNINDTYPLSYADRNFSKAGPREFLSLIYHCDAFISNSFHGTAFSILFHKPVYVFNRHRHKVNSRMESLLGLFGLGACIEPQTECHFDWEKTERIKSEELEKSCSFLNQLITP